MIMNNRIRIENKEYDVEMLSEESRKLISQITLAQQSVLERNNLIKVLNKAKNAYIDELKAEVIKEKTGVDLSDILYDD